MKKPKQYHTIKQPKNTTICGACLVAMITGHELDKIQAEMQTSTIHSHKYYREQEIIRYLATQGILTGMRAIPLHNPLHPANQIEFKWELLDHPAILAVKSKAYDYANHYVFWDGRHVRDSSWTSPNETDKLKDYHILEINPIYYYEPEDLELPLGNKLHEAGCQCTTCTTIREYNRKELKTITK